MSRKNAVGNINAPSPVRAGARPASPPVGRGATHRTVIRPRPLGGEAGPASFRGRVRGQSCDQLNRSGRDGLATPIGAPAEPSSRLAGKLALQFEF